MTPHPSKEASTLPGKEPQPGEVPLNEFAEEHGINRVRVKSQADALMRSGRSSAEELGVVRRGSTWWVVDREKLLAFAVGEVWGVGAIDPAWDTNELLAQRGRFYLSEVTRLLPFGSKSLYHQATIGKAVGIEKVDGLYVVNREPFSQWIIELWQTLKKTEA